MSAYCCIKLDLFINISEALFTSPLKMVSKETQTYWGKY